MTTPHVQRRRRVRRAAALACVTCLTFMAGLGVPASGDEPGPIPLSGDAVPAGPGHAAPRPPAAGLGDWRLVAALGGTFAVLVAARMAAVRRAAPPPPDVFEVLGTASLGGQHAVRIVRFGPKTLLVGVSATGANTLAEIADPQATACIAAACRDAQRPLREAAAAARPARRPAAKEVA